MISKIEQSMCDTPSAGLIGVPEAARYLGITVRSLRRYLSLKMITHIKLGGKPNSALRFRISHLDEFIESGLVQAKREVSR